MNFIKLKKFSLLFNYFIFIDTEEYLSDQIFINNRVRVWFRDELKHPDSKYIVIFCKVRKKRATMRFIKSMAKLEEAMAWAGNNDYSDFCKNLFDNMHKEMEKEKYEKRTNGNH